MNHLSRELGSKFDVERTENYGNSFQKAPSTTVGPDLDHLLEENGNAIPYIIVRGKVQPINDAIRSPTGLKGVLQVVTVNEHSVKRHAFGHWYVEQ